MRIHPEKENWNAAEQDSGVSIESREAMHTSCDKTWPKKLLVKSEKVCAAPEI